MNEAQNDLLVPDRNTILNDFAGSRLRTADGRVMENNQNNNVIENLTPERRVEVVNEAVDSLRKIVTPVFICLLAVSFVISGISFYSIDSGYYLPYTPFHEDKATSAAGKFGMAVANSLIIVGVVTGMTFLLVLLYYFHCYKIIYAWMIFVTIAMLFMFSSLFLIQFVIAFNLTLDYITFAFLTINFGVPGVMAIHWKSPLRVQQFYLIICSILMSLVFIKYLPPWTSWVFLVALAIYDVVAVLCPGGPLKLLLKVIQDNNQPLMPALIYSSMAWIVGATTNGSRSDKPSQDENANARGRDVLDTPYLHDLPHSSNTDNTIIEPLDGENQQQVEENSDELNVANVKLGLGDFIFYSVLIGKATSSNDWNTVYACTIGILTGLCTTLIVLFFSKHALPALPISITIGVIFYFTTYYCVSPMMDYMALHQVFL